MRSGASYSSWFNGNVRTTSYFHNIIGILTETQGNPTPMEIQFVPDLLGHPVRIGAGTITFINKYYAWHLVTGHLAIDCDALGLNPTHRTQDENSAVQNP